MILHWMVSVPPRWAFTAYAELWVAFQEKSFTKETALNVISKKIKAREQVFSNLKLLFIFLLTESVLISRAIDDEPVTIKNRLFLPTVLLYNTAIVSSQFLSKCASSINTNIFFRSHYSLY